MVQVRKAVQLSAAVALVVAVDIQETSSRTHSTTTPGTEVAEICGRAAAHSIPVVFALSRVGLGSVFGANKRMSGERAAGVSGHMCSCEARRSPAHLDLPAPVQQFITQGCSWHSLLLQQTPHYCHAYTSPLPCSCPAAVALTSVVGLEAHLQHVLHLAALGRARFALFQTQWGARIGAM